MSFISAFKAFFKTPNNDTNGITSLDAFTVASDCYNAVSNAVSPYTTHANAAYTDPADFEPYTAAYLDAHTAALDTLEMQMLQSHNERNYDVLRIKMKDGSMRNFWFDITSFYGNF
jgi:hypothetical protein